LDRPTTALPVRLAVLALLVLASPTFAQDKKPFRWGTDPTGGAPFIYQDNAGKYIGFEVELAEYLANKLGRTSVMVDGTWANLPQQLNKSAEVEKGIDVILNGYELRKDLVDQFGVSRAYYAYRLALITRKEGGVSGWGDLKGKSVGVLGGTVAHKHLTDHHADAEIQTNEDVANVIKLVNDKRMVATVQDNPAAVHFLKEYPDLTVTGEPVKAGYYVIYFRKGDTELGMALDSAIADGLRDGTFRRIYEKYGLWNDDQQELIGLLDKPWPPELEASRKENPWPRMLRELLRAAWMTVKLSCVSFPLAMLIGLAVAVGRVYGPRWVAWPLGVYVEVIRGTPLLLQLYALFYMLPVFVQSVSPELAAWFTPFLCGVLGLAINYSAYEAENYRAGLQAIPTGQIEAALSLGMPRRTAIRRIVVPQAVRLVIPPVTNDFIALFKDTSVCSAILITELTRKYNELYNFNRDLIVELVFITAGLYLLMSYPLAIVARRLERRLNRGERRAA
jgi:polar amino acid transport system substrate-binding protein